PAPQSTLLPYTTLFRSHLPAPPSRTAAPASGRHKPRQEREFAADCDGRTGCQGGRGSGRGDGSGRGSGDGRRGGRGRGRRGGCRSEEHTSELQSRFDIV